MTKIISIARGKDSVAMSVVRFRNLPIVVQYAGKLATIKGHVGLVSEGAKIADSKRETLRHMMDGLALSAADDVAFGNIKTLIEKKILWDLIITQGYLPAYKADKLEIAKHRGLFERPAVIDLMSRLGIGADGEIHDEDAYMTFGKHKQLEDTIGLHMAGGGQGAGIDIRRTSAQR